MVHEWGVRLPDSDPFTDHRAIGVGAWPVRTDSRSAAEGQDHADQRGGTRHRLRARKRHRATADGDRGYAVGWFLAGVVGHQMIRFDNSGHQVWDRQVTNLTSSRGGYDNGARFVWWYQHHGRLASDGKNYAAYFGVAITVQNGNCVDIHEGDRMQVVNASGALVSGHDSFAVGCSHAWTITHRVGSAYHPFRHGLCH